MVQNETETHLTISRLSNTIQIPNLNLAVFNLTTKLLMNPGQVKINFEQKKKSSNTSSLLVRVRIKNKYADTLFEAYKAVLK